MDFATLILSADTAGLKRAEPALDALAAKATKAEGATKRFSASARDMGPAAQAGARQVNSALDGIEAEARAAEAALRQASAGLDTMAMGATRAGTSSSAAAGQVGNLTAQVFDIGMMMQAGQNPFVLMVQQGSQVAQVLGPMGATGALQAFKGVFAQLISPVNLLTFGVIGLTAAVVPMVASFFSGSEAADKLNASLEEQKDITTALEAETQRLIIARQMLSSGAESSEEQRRMNELVRLTAERADLQRQLNELVELGGRAAGFAQQAAAKREILQAEIATKTAQLERLQTEQDLYAAAEKSREGADRMRALMEDIAGINLNGPWQAVLGAIDNAIAKADAFRATLAQAARNYGKIQNTGQSGPDAARRSVMGLNAPGLLTGELAGGAGGAWEAPKGGGGGGGGGGRSQAATEAEKQAEAIEKVVTALRNEVSQVGASQEARRLHQELQRAGVTIYSEEGQQIAALVEELTALEERQKQTAEVMRGIESAAQGFFVGVLSGAKDAQDAIGDLLAQLGNLLLNQAFKMLWGGTGGGGGVGAFFAGLFDNGGKIAAGQVGIVAEKRPEMVNGQLITRPTLVPGPADVTGGAATARMMGVPMPQTASRPRSTSQQMPTPRVTVAPAPVVVLDDPRKIDAYMRSPEGERSAAWQRRRSNG